MKTGTALDIHSDIFRIHADFCQCLASQKRLQIMWLLAEKERPVSELADLLEISITNVSQHLRVLRDKGAVTVRKEGKQVFYRISNEKFIKGCALIRQGLVENLTLKVDGIS